MAKGTKAEQRKRLMLAALGGLFVVVLIYQFFLSSPAKPPRKPTNSNTSIPATPTTTASQPSAAPSPQPRTSSGQAEEVIALLMQDLTPLDLRGPVASGPVEPDKERGNVFAFWVAPPPPPVPPPPPPPITLTGVTPASAVAGTPRKVTLTIVGSMIPVDAQLYFDGQPKQAKRLNEHQIAADLEPSEYTAPRTISITIKSASDPKLFSNTTGFTVQPSPEPQFRYIGRLGEQALFELTATKEIKRLNRGDSIMNQWRIDAINDQAVEVTLTAYDIKRRVPLTEKTR